MTAVDAAFVDTVRHLLSGDNALRNAAETRYADARQSQPQATVVALFQVLQERSLEQAVREQATVLLRQCLSKVKDEDSTWQKLPEPAQVDIKAKLLALLEVELLAPVRRKIADCVQSTGNQLIDLLADERPKNIQQWPELMPSLMRIICDTSKDSGVRADCLWTVKELACSIWQMLTACSEQTYQVLHMCLSDPAEPVRAEAAALLSSFVDNIENKNERKPFVPLIPEVSVVMAQSANSSDSTNLNTILQALQSTTETADFFKGHITTHLLPVLSGIAKSHADEAARKYAFEVIICFVESKPKMMIKVPGFVEQALEVCLHFMVQLQEDIQAWAAEEDEEDDEDEESYTFGKEAVDRICRCAQRVESFSPVLEVLKPAIARLFQSGEWKQVVAGISMLSQIAEYVDDSDTVSQMVRGIKMQLAATHARVRFVAWGALAQFAEDHPDVITTDTWAAELLPEFLKGIEDPCQRVSLRCMEAFQHYGESVEREDLEPYVQPLMEKVGTRLQGGNQLFQKKAITFIAVIAGQVDDAFAPYYGPLMPILKQVIQSTLHKVEERTLLGKCFECISLLAKSVGKDGFKADAEIIMQAMISATQVPNLPANDPVKEYMMAASERICATLKEDFLPFVPHILPQIIEKFGLSPKEFNSELADSLDEGGEVNLTMVKQDNGQVKIMIMYSSEMQDLKGALECVHTFVQELGKAYSPFVLQTATALLPVFDFSMAEEIRDLAYETWGELCGCARAADQLQIVNELVMEFLKRILPTFDANDIDLEAFKTRADGVTSCLKKAGAGILGSEQVRHITQTSLKLMAESLKRRDESKTAKKQPVALQGDDDGDAEDDDEEGEEMNLRISLAEIAGAVMQHHPDMFVAESFPSYLALVQQLLQPGVAADDRKLALFVMCDFLEHLGARVTAQWPLFLPQMLEDVLNQTAEMRQPSCYGLSLAAKDQAFAPLALDAAGKLSQVITESRRRSKKKSEKITQACADNALSALVEILLNHPAALGSAQAQLWSCWLSGLPCQEDEQEGHRNHRKLLQLLQQERPEVVGNAGQNVPKLIAILVDLYKTDMVDEETSIGIGQLALRLGAALEGMAAQFSEKQRKKLMRILREAQKQAA